MKRFLIEKQAYDLPTCWDEVTYSQYVALLTMKDSLPEFLSLFTGLSIDYLYNAKINSVEGAWKTLSFLKVPPEFKPKPTNKVGPYPIRDAVIKTVGQYDDLRKLLTKAPSPVLTIEDNLLVADMYLEACAIITTKNKYGKYQDSHIVKEVKEEIKSYSSVEILQTGAFFLLHVLKMSQPHQLN